MFGLIRSLCTLVGFIVISAGAAYLFRDRVAGWILAEALANFVGMEAVVEESAAPGDLPVRATAGRVLLRNPAQFEIASGYDIANLHIQLDQPALQEGTLVVEKVSLSVEGLNLIRRSNGEINLLGDDSSWLQDLLPMPLVRVRQIQISLHKVAVYDFAGERGMTPTKLSLDGEELTLVDVTRGGDVQMAILSRIAAVGPPWLKQATLAPRGK